MHDFETPPVKIDFDEVAAINVRRNSVIHLRLPSYHKYCCVRPNGQNKAKLPTLKVANTKAQTMAICHEEFKYVTYMCGHCGNYHVGRETETNPFMRLAYDIQNLFRHVVRLINNRVNSSVKSC